MDNNSIYQYYNPLQIKLDYKMTTKYKTRAASTNGYNKFSLKTINQKHFIDSYKELLSKKFIHPLNLKTEREKTKSIKPNNHLKNIVLEFRQDSEEPKDMNKRIILVSNIKVPKRRRHRALKDIMGYSTLTQFKKPQRDSIATKQSIRKQCFYSVKRISQQESDWRGKMKESSKQKKDITLKEIFNNVVIDEEEIHKEVNFFKLPVYSTNSSESISSNMNIHNRRNNRLIKKNIDFLKTNS